MSIEEMNKIVGLFGIEFKIENNKLSVYEIETGQLLQLRKFGNPTFAYKDGLSLDHLGDNRDDYCGYDIYLESTDKIYVLRSVCINYEGVDGLFIKSIERVIPNRDNMTYINDECEIPYICLADVYHTPTIWLRHRESKKTNKLDDYHRPIWEEIDYEEICASNSGYIDCRSKTKKCFLRVKYDKNEEVFKNVNQETISNEEVYEELEKFYHSELFKELIKQLLPNLYELYSKTIPKKL